MAEVQVFVDDAVRGDLPRRCAKTALPTDAQLTIASPVGGDGGVGLAWLLVFLGPIGWGILILFALTRRPAETLLVRLPMSDEASERYRQWRRFRAGAAGVSILSGAVLVLAAYFGDVGDLEVTVYGGIAIAGFLAALFGEDRASKAHVGVSLDASRRWVTLSRVHPDFVTACVAHHPVHHDRR